MANKYEEWTLKDLKDELRKRKAKLSGRKHELVERLQAYDRNNNFKGDVVMEPEHVMDIPPSEEYKDLNSDSKVTSVSFETTNDYLEELEKTICEKSNKLADARFLKYIRWAKTCRAEMKKAVSYLVDVQCDNNGVIIECQCECAAGMGPKAHCKHVCALLYALAKFTDDKTVLTESTCTEKLQTFHQVKRKAGSPVKAQDLLLYGKANIRFDPRPHKYRKMSGYNDYVRNLCLNYSEKGSSMPIKQLYNPANVYALEHDHDYLLHPQSDCFLNYVYSDSSKVESLTRDQSKSTVWGEERSVRLTASNFGRICKATDRTDKERLAASFTEVVKIDSAAINHGRKFEKVALAEYSKAMKTKVSPCGLFVDKNRPYIAATPDGIVNEDILVEIKCPKSAYRKPITHAIVPYLKYIGERLTLDKKHDYYYQVQGQLTVANKQICHFVVWTEVDMRVIIVLRDAQFVEDMLKKLSMFCDKFFKEAILRRYFYKN